MSKLNKLIQELCPNGVEYRKLGEIGEFENIGVDKKIVEGQSLVKLLNYVDVYKNAHINNSLPQMIVSASDKKIEACTCEEGDIFLTPTSETRDDIGHAAVVTETLSNTVYSYHIMRFRLTEKNMITSFFVRYLFETDIVQKQIYKLAKGLTRYGLSKYDFAKLSIPLPPLPIQEEIVKILDRFAEYTAELQAELQARKEQYEYYRNLLLTNNFAYGSADDKQKITGNAREEWKWMTLGEVGTFTYGYTDKAKNSGDTRFIRITDITEDGCLNPEGAMFIDSSEENKKYLLKKGDLLMARTGATYGKTLYVPNDTPSVYASFLIKISLDNNIILNRYYWHFSKSCLYWDQANKLASKGGQPQFNANALSLVKVLLPPLAEQQRIVSILDKFEALVSDLTQGLPAEIAASQERYEYYRDKLLRFERCN